MSWMYLEGRTDMERRYRKEWEENFSGIIRGRWENGKLITSGENAGFPIEVWQLDQHMHFLNQEKRRKCFPGCRQCEKTKSHESSDEKRERIIGKPWPLEDSGDFPCPDYICKEAFSYRSQLMRHLEKEHKVAVEWDTFCDVCGFETIASSNPKAAIARHKSTAHKEYLDRENGS